MAEQIPRGELERLARQGCSMARAAEFLGVHWTTLHRAAKAHGVTFQRPRTYGWFGIERVGRGGGMRKVGLRRATK